MGTKTTKTKARSKKEVQKALDHLKEIVQREQVRYFRAKMEGLDGKDIEASGAAAVGIKKALEWVLGKDNEFETMIKAFGRIDAAAEGTLEDKDELQDWEFHITPTEDFDADHAFTMAHRNDKITM